MFIHDEYCFCVNLLVFMDYKNILKLISENIHCGIFIVDRMGNKRLYTHYYNYKNRLIKILSNTISFYEDCKLEVVVKVFSDVEKFNVYLNTGKKRKVLQEKQ